MHTKTRDVLQKLRVIAGDGSVTQEVSFRHEQKQSCVSPPCSLGVQALAATIPNAALLRFLFSLAQAEGLT